MELNNDIKLIIEDNLNHNDNFIKLIKKKDLDSIYDIIFTTLKCFNDKLSIEVKNNIKKEILEKLLNKDIIPENQKYVIYTPSKEEIKLEKEKLKNIKKKIIVPDNYIFSNEVLTHSNFWNNLNDEEKINYSIKRVKEIQSIEQLIQRSLEWYTFTISTFVLVLLGDLLKL